MRSAATSSATAAANRVPAPRTSDPGAAAGSCQAGIKPAVASALQALTRNAASLKERGEGRKEGGKGTFGSTCQGASVAGDGLLDRTSAQQSPCAWEGSPAAVLAGLINQQPATSADSQMECDEAMRPTPGLLRRVGSNRQIHLPMEVQAQAWAAWAPHLNVVGKGLYAEGDAFGWHAPVSRSPCTSPKRVGHGSQSVKQSTGEGTGQGLCHRPQGSTVTDSCNAAAAAGTEPLEVAGRPMVFSTYVAPTQQPDKPVATEDLPAAQHVHDSEDEGVQLGPEGEEVFAQHGQLEETLAVQMDAWEEAQTDPWGFGLGTAGGKKGKAQGSTGVRANTAQAGASQQWWQQGTAGAMRMHEAGAVPWHEAGPWAGDQWPGLLRGMDAWATWVPGATGKGEEDADSKAEGAVVGTAGDSGAGETQLVSAAEPSISAACAANTQAAALAPVLVCDERDVRALGVGLPPVGPLASIHHQAVETVRRKWTDCLLGLPSASSCLDGHLGWACARGFRSWEGIAVVCRQWGIRHANSKHSSGPNHAASKSIQLQAVHMQHRRSLSCGRGWCRGWRRWWPITWLRVHSRARVRLRSELHRRTPGGWHCCRCASLQLLQPMTLTCFYCVPASIQLCASAASASGLIPLNVFLPAGCACGAALAGPSSVQAGLTACALRLGFRERVIRAKPSQAPSGKITVLIF